jgi:signal peptidase II
MRIYWTLIIIVLVLLDQVSKWMVETMLPLQQQIEVIPFLSLFRTYNFGVAFSLLEGLGQWPLVIMTAVIIGFVIWLWRGLGANRILSEFGYAFVIGGAIGNLIDRAFLGKVIDMILFHIDSLEFRFAVFNLADTFITIGAMAIILDEILIWRRLRKETKEQDKEVHDG